MTRLALLIGYIWLVSHGEPWYGLPLAALYVLVIGVALLRGKE